MNSFPQVTPKGFACRNHLRFKPEAIEALQVATETLAVRPGFMAHVSLAMLSIYCALQFDSRT